MSELNNTGRPNKGRGRNTIPEAQLIAYLEGKLSANEQHEVERWLAGEGMESDALEGLQALSPGETRNITDRINHQLQKDLHGKKKKRRYLSDSRWTLLAIIIVLMLSILGYILIRLSVKI